MRIFFFIIILIVNTLFYSELLATDKVLILPVLIRNKQYILWENNNHWKYALNKYMPSEDKQRFIIPVGDLDDISLINYDLTQENSYNQFKPILDKYHTQEVLIATASYFINPTTNLPTLKLSLKTINAQNTTLKEKILNDNNNSLQFLLEQAVKELNHTASFADTKNQELQELIDIKTTNVIMIVNIENLKEWLVIKHKLTAIKNIRSMIVKELSTEKVILDIDFQGQITAFIEALESSSFKAHQHKKNNTIIISS